MNTEAYHIERSDMNDDSPIVSVVLPSFNSEKTIERSIDSIVSQTYRNWELLVVNDYGSDDTAEIIREYIQKDPRIVLIQTHERFGLADSLNLGIALSRGKYIARMDSDDVSMPKRFEKQIRILDSDDRIGICGTWQKHIGKTTWVHKAAKDDARCRAHLLFWCDLCHSTLMFRKQTFIDNDLRYDGSFEAEDYELWTRAMEYMRIVNIPEILGNYYEDYGITNFKLDSMSKENGCIVSKNLCRFFGIQLNDGEEHLFDQWNYSLTDDPERDEKLVALERILRGIWRKNEESNLFDNAALLESLSTVWYKSRYDSNIGDRTFINPKRIDDIFDDRYISSKIIRYRVFRRINRGLLKRIKGLFRILLNKQE